MPNFCINFLNKAAKLLSISYDFAVAPSSDAWIKTRHLFPMKTSPLSHPPRMRGLKPHELNYSHLSGRRTLLGCVD